MPKQENITQEQKIPFAEMQEIDKADFLLALESLKEIKDEAEMKTAIGEVVFSALKFFETYPEDEQAFPFLMKKMDILKISCDRNVFDRSFSQAQVDELINLICENKKDEKSQHAEYFAYGLFSTSSKNEREIDTLSDQTAIALTKKLQRGETVKSSMTQELNAWLQHSQMIDDKLRLELICAVLNNPGHTSDRIADALIREQANFSGVMLERIVEQAEGKELNVIMKVLDVLEAVARFGQWEECMEAGGQRAFDKLEEIYENEDNYFLKTRLELIVGNLKNSQQESKKRPFDDLDQYKEKISPLSSQFYDQQKQKELFVENCAYNAVSNDYGVIYTSKGQVDSFFKLNAENNTNLELKDILASSHTQWEAMTQEQQRNLVDNYRVLISPAFRLEIEQKFKIQLKDFDLRTQVQFLNFISSRNKEEIEKVVNFITSDEDVEIVTGKLKAFLALELKDAEGAKILQVGEKMPAEKAAMFFQKISELADLAGKERLELQAMLFQKERQQEIPKIQQELLRKAYALVEKFSAEFSQAELDEQKIETFLSDLEKSKTEIVLLATALKSGATLEQLKGWEVSIVRNPDERQQTQMIEIEERNWTQIEKMKDKVVASFKAAFEDGQEREWYVAEFEQQVASFLAFTRTKHGTLYFGSFNVDFEARGLGIGNVMMDKVVAEKARCNILEATASPRIPAGTAYVERMGFVIDGIIANYHKTGEPLFCIKADKQKNSTYQYRNEGKEIEIGEEAIKKQALELVEVESLIGTESFVLKFDMENDFANMKATMKKLLIAKDDEGEEITGQMTENKYLITRYFKDKNETEKDVRYFLFEKIKNI